MKKFYNFNMVPRAPDVQYEGGQQIDGQPVPKEVQQEIDNAQEALAAEAAKLFAR